MIEKAKVLTVNLLHELIDKVSVFELLEVVDCGGDTCVCELAVDPAQ
jgi:hypothetical protein